MLQREKNFRAGGITDNVTELRVTKEQTDVKIEIVFQITSPRNESLTQCTIEIYENGLYSKFKQSFMDQQKELFQKAFYTCLGLFLDHSHLGQNVGSYKKTLWVILKLLGFFLLFGMMAYFKAHLWLIFLSSH